MAIITLNNNSLSSVTSLPAGVGGKVLQVVTATDSTTRTTTSTSFVTGSNTLSLNITPSATSSKIFIMVNATGYNSDGNDNAYTIYRDSTNLGTSTGITENRLTWNPLSMSTLDSPSSTSQLTYQVYFRNLSGTVYLNNGNTGRITAFEIEG